MSDLFGNTNNDPQIRARDYSDVGLLKKCGYSVGANARPDSERQQLLTKIFDMENIPALESQADVLSWGKAGTDTRLKKMANVISTQCRKIKARKNVKGCKRAIDRWEKDLMWLKHTYFLPLFDGKFIWPTI
jgi:hypothetical protein